MKIVIMTNYANGLYLFRKELLQAFLQSGMNVKVSLPPDENVKKIEELGCEVIPTQFERRGINPIHDIKLFFFYLKMIKHEKPDMVLTYTIKPNLYGGLACRLTHTPYLCNITGLGTALESGGMLSRFLLAFYKISLKKAKCVFFQNDTNRQFMQEHGIKADKIRLLPGSGVNLKDHPFVPYPDESNGIVFLSVIRIMKDKGIEEFLNAAELMHKKHENIRFLLVGEYEEETRKYYEPWIKKLEEMGTLQYMGHIDYVAKVMAESHVIVHPSYHEGLSNVLLEAAACGRAVLASDVQGCRETLQNGLSGLTFAPKSTDSLVRALETILTYTESDREEMGKRGREYVESEFDRNKVIHAYFEEINNTMV